MTTARPSKSAERAGPSLIDDFLRQARERPRALAVRDAGCAWSYEELLDRCRQVAGFLAGRNAVRRRAVLFAGKSCHAAAGILGTLMAGWSYACVDEGYPPALVEKACHTIGPDLVLIANEGGEFASEAIRCVTDTYPHYDLPDLCRIGPGAGAPDGLPVESLTPGRGEDIAYFGFTSGSTGTPKVIAMSHRGFHDSVRRHVADFGFGPLDRVGVQSCFAFDPAVMDLLSAVWTGGTAVMVPSELYRDGEAWSAYLQRHHVTSLHCVPGALELAFEGLEVGRVLAPLRRLILTGDTVQPYLLRILARRLPEDTRIYNAYGLSEAPYILTGEIDVHDPSSANRFARPVSAPHVRFDRDAGAGNGQVPAALRLGVGGSVLFSGYATAPDHLHLPCDDEGLFDVGDVFVADDGGDVVRYVGRRDRRLNWWGHRVEPEEIERALCADGRITSARVVVDARGELVCGIVSDLDFSALEPSIRDRLRGTSLACFAHKIKLNLSDNTA